MLPLLRMEGLRLWQGQGRPPAEIVIRTFHRLLSGFPGYQFSIVPSADLQVRNAPLDADVPTAIVQPRQLGTMSYNSARPAVRRFLGDLVSLCLVLLCLVLLYLVSAILVSANLVSASASPDGPAARAARNRGACDFVGVSHRFVYCGAKIRHRPFTVAGVG